MGIVAILTLAPTLSAAPEPRTLLGGDTRLEPFAAVMARGTTASASTGVLGGLRLGLVADKALFVGLAGFYSLLEPEARTAGTGYNAKRLLRFGYGGLELGYVLSASEHTRITLRGLAGAGAVGHHPDGGNGPYVGNDTFFVLEPGVDATVGLFGPLQATVGFGYRLAYGVDLGGLSGTGGRVDALDGFNLDLAFGIAF
jgi:hypothetical protein